MVFESPLSLISVAGNSTQNFRVWDVVVPLALMPIIVIGNVLVITVYLTDRSVRRTPFNRYILSLAVADLLTGSVAIPLHLVVAVVFRDLTRYLVVESVSEWFIRFPVFVSVFIVIAMSYDRFLLASDPMKFQATSSNGHNDKAIAVAWITGFGLCTTFVILKACGVLDLALFGMFLFCIVLLVVLIYLNVMFLYKVMRSMPTTRSVPTGGPTNSAKRCMPIDDTNDPMVSREELGHTSANIPTTTGQSNTNDLDNEDNIPTQVKRRRLRKTATRLLIYVSVFCVCNVPIGITYGVVAFGGSSRLVYPAELLALTNTALNPLIYAATSNKFMAGLKGIRRRLI